jgi:predicted kinase
MVCTNSTGAKRIVYLLHGFIGSGKTTFAKILEKEKCAMRLTHDDFMILLYGQNPPANLFKEYYDRITKMIWKLTSELVELHVPVILDFGFWTKDSRREAIDRVYQMGATPLLYVISCNPVTMKERCLRRNMQGDDTLLIDEAAFDNLFKLYEPISEDEEHVLVKTD